MEMEKNIDKNCAVHWTTEQTKLLLSLYKNKDGKLSNGTITTKEFYSQIVEEMREHNYTFTAKQCTTKIDSLKRIYKKIKDNNSQSGKNPRTCEFFEQLDEIFHKKPWIKPLSIAGSNLPMNMPEQGETRKRRPTSDDDVRNWYLQQCLEKKRLKKEADARFKEEKLKIMREYVSKRGPNQED